MSNMKEEKKKLIEILTEFNPKPKKWRIIYQSFIDKERTFQQKKDWDKCHQNKQTKEQNQWLSLLPFLRAMYVFSLLLSAEWKGFFMRCRREKRRSAWLTVYDGRREGKDTEEKERMALNNHGRPNIIL